LGPKIHKGAKTVFIMTILKNNPVFDTFRPNWVQKPENFMNLFKFYYPGENNQKIMHLGVRNKYKKIPKMENLFISQIRGLKGRKIHQIIENKKYNLRFCPVFPRKFIQTQIIIFIDKTDQRDGTLEAGAMSRTFVFAPRSRPGRKRGVN